LDDCVVVVGVVLGVVDVCVFVVVCIVVVGVVVDVVRIGVVVVVGVVVVSIFVVLGVVDLVVSIFSAKYTKVKSIPHEP
jgi:hypothetical protein